MRAMNNLGRGRRVIGDADGKQLAASESDRTVTAAESWRSPVPSRRDPDSAAPTADPERVLRYQRDAGPAIPSLAETDMKFRPTLVAFSLGLSRGAGAANAGAEGNAERGKVLAYTCHGCHGVPNYKNAYPNYSVPKLGGQNAST